jgi:hypothetical protein
VSGKHRNPRRNPSVRGGRKLRKIQGYKLNNLPVEKIKVPLGAEVFSALDVNGEPTVFAVIDPNEVATQEVTVYRVTTGKPFDDKISSKKYIGSFTIANYGIVYHFYVAHPANEVPIVPVADLTWVAPDPEAEVGVEREPVTEEPLLDLNSVTGPELKRGDGPLPLKRR